MKKLYKYLSSLLFAGSLAFGGTAAVADDHEVVVGFAASYSGWMEAYSGPSTNAAMLAIEDINANEWFAW